jgi:transposase
MKEYTIRSAYASIIALDVHARTTTAKGLNYATGEIKQRRFNDCPGTADITSWIEEHFDAPYYCAYESGCTGFNLARKLDSLNIACDVIAVSTIARSRDEKTGKSDRKDAKGLLRELISPASSLSKVWMPDTECEGIRDLLRSYSDIKRALRRSKQQLLALLLRYGWVYNEKTASGRLKRAWTKSFWEWLDKISLSSPAANEALAIYRLEVEGLKDRSERILKIITLHSEQTRWKPYVDALLCIKGVGLASALLYASEIGDFTRFRSGRAVSKWIGTTPKSHASGEKRQANGSITKAGNSHIRIALIEGISNIGIRTDRTEKPKSGRIVSDEVFALCKKCNRRLLSKYRHLVDDLGKQTNVAKIAIASEMIRWIWMVGLSVQEEQAKIDKLSLKAL